MIWLSTAIHILIYPHINTKHTDALLVPLATYIGLGVRVGPVVHQQLAHCFVAEVRGQSQGCASILQCREVKMKVKE